MRIFTTSKIRFFGLFVVLIFLTNLPVWSVENYINQDGSPHIYNAYIILELLKGNPAFTQIYALNSAPIPNLTGHWMLVALLVLFPPSIVTKIMVTFLFAAFVAAVVWLRRQVSGQPQDLITTVLIGTVLAFNWMWFLGFYNFIIGVIGFTFTLGLYWRWRDNLNFYRSLILSVLLTFTFFSHLISFLVLAGSLVVLSIFADSPNRKKAVSSTFFMILPVLPFIIGYKLLSTEAGGETFPVWRNLSNPFSLSSWIFHLQTADVFQLLSRKTLPFTNYNSNLSAIFSPSLWFAAALILLSLATRFSISKKEIFTRRRLPFILLVFFSLLIWIFAPDDFGKSHGSFLRERVLLCGLIFFVPLFRSENARWLSGLARFFLICIIIFQTAALWEYSLNADKLGREYLSGTKVIADNDSLGAINLIENSCRYKSSPLGSITVLYGIGKNTRIWDNYEIGYYLFPVVLQNPSDRQFVNEFRDVGNFELCSANENISEKFGKLTTLLDLHSDKISVMLVWGNDERVDAVLKKSYQDKPFFQNGRVRLFHHR